MDWSKILNDDHTDCSPEYYEREEIRQKLGNIALVVIICFFLVPLFIATLILMSKSM